MIKLDGDYDDFFSAKSLRFGNQSFEEFVASNVNNFIISKKKFQYGCEVIASSPPCTYANGVEMIKCPEVKINGVVFLEKENDNVRIVIIRR